MSFSVKLFWNHCGEKSPIDKVGETPLFDAIRSNNLDIVEFFLNNGIKLEDNKSRRSNPLKSAVENGDLKMVKFLYLKSVDKNPKTYGETLLHSAAKRGNLEIFKFLYNNTEEKQQRNDYEESPLDLAILENNIEIVKFLAQSGNYDFNKPSKSGTAPLHYASGYNRYSWKEHSITLDMVKLILENVENKEPIHSKGNSPLHYAAKRGNLDIFKILWKEAGDSKTAKNEENQTPLDIAVDSYSYEIKDFILEELSLE